MQKRFDIATKKDGWYVIDDEVKACVRESGVSDGICVISTGSDTAALAITSSWDPKGIDDAVRDLKAKFPPRLSYECPYSPFASAGRSRASISGACRSLIIKDGKLVLGHSQTILLMEFDGAMKRSVHVSIVPKELYFKSISFVTCYGEMTDLTERTAKIVEESGIKEGYCHVTVQAATAGVVLAPRDKAVREDIWEDIERLIPTRADFKHRETASDAAGHTKSFIAGTQIDIPVRSGRLLLSDGQGIIYTEFDGPRPRDLKVAVYEA